MNSEPISAKINPSTVWDLALCLLPPPTELICCRRICNQILLLTKLRIFALIHHFSVLDKSLNPKHCPCSNSNKPCRRYLGHDPTSSEAFMCLLQPGNGLKVPNALYFHIATYRKVAAGFDESCAYWTS